MKDLVAEVQTSRDAIQVAVTGLVTAVGYRQTTTLAFDKYKASLLKASEWLTPVASDGSSLNSNAWDEKAIDAFKAQTRAKLSQLSKWMSLSQDEFNKMFMNVGTRPPNNDGKTSKWDREQVLVKQVFEELQVSPGSTMKKELDRLEKDVVTKVTAEEQKRAEIAILVETEENKRNELIVLAKAKTEYSGPPEEVKSDITKLTALLVESIATRNRILEEERKIAVARAKKPTVGTSKFNRL